jgi:hypothetical protein
MDGQPLALDGAQRIMGIVKQTFGDVFHAYFIGLPDNLTPPQDAFPFVIVDKAAGSYNIGPTQTDEVTESIYIHIFADVKTGFGSPPDDDTVKRQLQTLVEGRDPTTGYLLPTSLMYALRTHLTLQNSYAQLDVPGFVTINNDITISYDGAKRSDWPETREAVIDVTITERLIVPNRT